MIAAAAFERRVAVMNLPRLLLTPHLMGRPFGAPHDKETQRAVLLAALNLLETAVSVGTIERFERQ